MESFFLNNNLESYISQLANILGNPADFQIIHMTPEKVFIYLNGLVDETRLHQRIDEIASERINFPLKEYLKDNPNQTEISLKLSSGNALYVQWKEKRIVVSEIPVAGWQRRKIEEPSSEQVIRGPREGFTENITVNTAMIRRWIQDPNFRVDEMRVGVRTQTAVRILYLADVANEKLVGETKRRICAIKIDGLLESGYLEQLIVDNRLTIFPLIQCTERSDKVASAILEGRVAILVDKSPFALIVPTTINELYQSPEDYYFNYYLGSFLRVFRLLGNNLAVALSGLYIALSSNNPELLPTSFVYSIAESRRGIPYPIFVEVLLLEIMVEVFREAGLRLPKNVNQTLGVVAGIGLALAAVQTHLVSGASLVVVAIGAIASFSAPSFVVGIPWRLFKFMLIFGAAFMGIVGLTLTGIMILAHAATLTSFGTSYLAPWAPFDPRGMRDSIIRQPFWMRFFRPRYYHSKEKKRMAKTKNEEEHD
jgi:hypothetical protein